MISNLEKHKKANDPTKEKVTDLMECVEKAIKTLF